MAKSTSLVIPFAAKRPKAGNFHEFGPILTHCAAMRGKIGCFNFDSGRGLISTDFPEADRVRFRNLLELANSSKFEGERANALAAATRLARKHGMTIDEAASWQPEVQEAPKVYARTARSQRSNIDPRAYQHYAADAKAQQDEKARWEEALRKAKSRGLDREENRKKKANDRPRSFSRARRNPVKHAEVLLRETSLTFSEIAEITGLDLYDVVAMKLKLRRAA